MIPASGPQTVFLYNLCYAIFAMLCYAIFAMQSLLCNLGASSGGQQGARRQFLKYRATGSYWGYLGRPGLPGGTGNPRIPRLQGYWQLLGLPGATGATRRHRKSSLAAAGATKATRRHRKTLADKGNSLERK